jgi:hypothetical protein
MSISPGFTPAEIREFVVEYHLLPHGQKGPWRAAQGVSVRQLRRWEAAVFVGDLDRGLIPREGGAMTVPPAKRTALSMAQAAKQDPTRPNWPGCERGLVSLSRPTRRWEKLSGSCTR